jgi:copper resistance protein B
VSPWWELLAGVRQDFLPGHGQTRGVVGIQGMAPYRIEVSANAYIGGATRAAVTLELEYDMLLTNRLVLQPVVEVELHARDDASRGIGKGLGTVEGGLRLRYELDRRFAPYLGYSWSQTHGRTARLRENAGDPASDSGWLAGVRIWF